MMAMKDLFCLVNAFMNRNKSTEEDREIELPIEAAEDTRVLPGSNSTVKAKNGTQLSSLAPYQHLLPDLCGMDLNQQKKLQKALYNAGVSATLSLHKLLQEAPKRKGSENTNPDESNSNDIDGKEILDHLSKSVLNKEDPTKTFQFMSQNIDEIMQKMDGGKMLMNMISNELAAASLAAFASVTLRKPLTKQVESLMQTAQEMNPSIMEEEEETEDGSDSSESIQLKGSSSTENETIPFHSTSTTTNVTTVISSKDREKQQQLTCCSQSNKLNVGTTNGGQEQNEEDDIISTIGSNPIEDELEDEDSLLRYVCAAGYEDLAKLLVSMRNSAEFSQQTSSTPLMESCCGGHADVVRTLIQAGANVNAISNTGNTALIYACASGHVECVRELLSTERIDLDVRNEAGHDAMMEAANNGNVDIMKLLVQYGAKPSCVVDNTEYKESALTLASYKGHFDVVNYLLSLMPNEKNTQEDEELHTALMEAAMDGHANVGKLLLNAGAKVNMMTESFENPLTLASCGGHIEMVKLLCDAGANLEEPNDEGYTPLMEASREGHCEVVEYLLIRGANVNAKIEEGLETSLTLAASGGFKNVVEMLAKRGGDLTIGERTPLYEACQEGHQEVAKFIVQWLRKSHSLGEIQKDLNEALLCAAGIDSMELTSLLIDNGAQIDCFSKENRTPLMEASRQNCLNVVELLIKKGADVNKIAPGATKEVDPGTGTTKTKGSKKLTQKDCCPALKCPCCIPPSLQKSAKEVCTAAGIPPAPYSTSTTSNVTNSFGATGKRPAAPSRSGTPNVHKCPTKSSSSVNSQPSKQQCSLSNSSSNATLSDPAAWMDNNATCDAQNNDTALTLACVGGHTCLVSLLVKRGAHLEHRDRKGFTPLILAATGGHVEISQLLIEAGACVDAQADRTKDTALSMACSGGRKEVVELLLKHGANKEHRNLSDYTPLSLAASGGYVDIIQLLLSNGAEINSRTNSKLGISPLMLAAMNGHEAATRLLLENGSDINAQIETNKNTALTLACFQGRDQVARLLIQYGANVEHRAKTGLTPLMEAANGGYVDVGRVLLSANADVNAPPVPTSRDTALTIAADKGHHTIVQLLLENDAQINARNKKGCTAMWLACNGGHYWTVKVLVEHKADTEAQDNRKLTPLMVAFRKGHHEVVNYLVGHVTQFPSDSDCQRFILAQTDEELINKCTQCIRYIKEAKAKQAEQANKAAASLLEQLAHEEAQEESRKAAKQRQKEKKKAKKQAKKVESPEQNEPLADDNALVEMIVNDVEEHQHIKKPTKKHEAEKSPEQEKTHVISEEIEGHSPKILQTSKQTKKEQKKLQLTPLAISTETVSHKEQKQASRKTTATNQQSKKENDSNNTKKMAVSPVKSLGEEDDWLRASKKRASIMKVVEAPSTPTSVTAPKTPTAIIAQTANTASIPPLFPEEAVEGGGNSSGRRPSLQVLNIASNAIPRVIGRAGANVNMIREATGAHVEVEKQSLRKEQAMRKITIKGPPEAVRNAVRMIQMLMKDHNLMINEIVERVMNISCQAAAVRKSPSLSTSSDTPSLVQVQHQIRSQETKAPLSTNNDTPSSIAKAHEEMSKLSLQQVHPAATLLAKSSSGIKCRETTVEQSNSNTKSPADAISSTATTNIWQKRAEAIREKNSPQINLAVGENPFSTGNLFSPSSPLATESNSSTQANSVQPQTPIAIDSGNSEIASLSKEEHQRKAPGYARPQSSTSTNLQQTIGMQPSLVDKMSIDGSNMPSLYDNFASKWASNPLDLVDETEASTVGNIQNSWSYLLDERKSNERPQTMQPYRIQTPPIVATDSSAQTPQQNMIGSIWPNSANNQPPLSSSVASNNGSENCSAFFTPVKTSNFKPPQMTPNLPAAVQPNAVLYAQSRSQQQQLYQQQHFNDSQRMSQQQASQEAPFWAPTFVTPTIMQVAMQNERPVLSRFAPSPTFQLQRNPMHHPPPGFVGMNSAAQPGVYPLSQQPPQLQSTFPSNAFPPPSTLQQPLQNPHQQPTSQHQQQLHPFSSTASVPPPVDWQNYNGTSSPTSSRFNAADFRLRRPL